MHNMLIHAMYMYEVYPYSVNSMWIHDADPYDVNDVDPSYVGTYMMCGPYYSMYMMRIHIMYMMRIHIMKTMWIHIMYMMWIHIIYMYDMDPKQTKVKNINTLLHLGTL